MRLFLSILIFVCSAWGQAGNHPSNSADAQTAAVQTTPPAAKVDNSTNRQGKALIEKAIEALGGQTYLTIFATEKCKGAATPCITAIRPVPARSSGRSRSFPTKSASNSPKSATSRSYISATKATRSPSKACIRSKKKILIDYNRRRHYSLDTILRNWINDPTVVILYEGNALAAQHNSEKVTLINAKNESVSLFFDMFTHLPVKKSFEWRDPVDRQKNLEEEIYDNYRKARWRHPCAL